MADALENAPENSQELLDNSEQLPDNSENSQEWTVVKRGRGRPKGSTDSAPRKRRIVEEPVAPPPKPTPPEPATPIEPVRIKTRQPKPVEAAVPATTQIATQEPPSPRTLIRQAGETIYQLQSQRDSARRDFWAQQIHKSLR